jgi:dienelactone hydrolase
MTLGLAALTLAGCATSSSQADKSTPGSDPLNQVANELFASLQAGDEVRASAHFDAKMREVLPPATLQRVWKQMTDGLGRFVWWKIVDSTGAVRVADLSFEKGELRARVNLDAVTLEVTGLHFVPRHDAASRCEALLKALQHDDLAAVAKLAPTLSRQVVRASWHELTDGYGRLISWKQSEEHRAGALTGSVYELQFEKGKILARIAVDPKRDQIVGLFFRPVEAEVSYAAPADAPYTAEDVTIPVGDYVLVGTLLLPKGAARPVPAVLTITGSGQQTRDEPLPIPGLSAYRPFRQIAIALASHGIAVLRVDDRGVGKSTGTDTLAKATTSSFADDARAEVAFLRGRRDIDGANVALLGHSEGADIAAMLAATDARIAAIVLMAGTGKAAFAVLEDQLRDALSHDPDKTPAQIDAAVADQRKQLHELAESHGELPASSAGLPWLREFLQHDSIATIRKVHQPILVLQGALDRQVTAEQAQALAEAARAAGNHSVEVEVFERLNHLFLPAATGSVEEYSTLTVTEIPAPVLDRMTGWLEARLAAGH